MPNFMSPSGVNLQQPWGGSPPRAITNGPYTTGASSPKPVKDPMQPPAKGTPLGIQPGQMLGSESIRATGSGPFDSTYRQNLATYGGGQFQRPGGNLSFNPTSTNPFQGMGQATGGGNAPIFGGPNVLLSNAFGGQGFAYTPPAATQSTKAQTPYWQNPNWQQWLNQLTNQGGLLRGY